MGNDLFWEKWNLNFRLFDLTVHKEMFNNFYKHFYLFQMPFHPVLVNIKYSVWITKYLGSKTFKYQHKWEALLYFHFTLFKYSDNFCSPFLTNIIFLQILRRSWDIRNFINSFNVSDFWPFLWYLWKTTRWIWRRLL